LQIAINLTETRQIQEMEAINDSTTEKLALTAHAANNNNNNPELQALHDTPPLVEIAKPLIEKTIEGIRGMGKIVGSATPVDKITPELLAVAAQVKEQTDKEIMLPMMELNEHIRARKQEIVVMFNNQMTQLHTLRKMIAKLKQGETDLSEKLEVISSNAESLAKRSASVLQAAHDLQPTITQAEFDYFQELQRLQDRAKQWTSQIDRLKLKASALRDASQNSTSKAGVMSIDEGTRQNLHAMLKASETRMKNYSTRLKDAEYRVDELAAVVGWDRDPQEPVGLRQ
jgi:DNA repair exonuclease SbcCD ATPase subunit